MKTIGDTAGDADSTVEQAPLPGLAAPAVSDGNEEFPIPFARFAASLRHTPDEVYETLMGINHGRENRLPSAWRSLLAGYKNQPAHPDHPAFTG